MSAHDTLAPDEPLDFDCPRCRRPVSEEFYGPCTECVEQLRATMLVQAEAVEKADYVPKMNVTPNAVALKD
jgi:hypothetical protein